MSTTTDDPLVSIGLPVYNGEKYLAESIATLLAQTYTNIELIICDNASTDGTREVCECFAATDSRVRYHRNETNIGGANNHNLTFELASGKYFRWAAHDDIAEPELIKRCVEVLEARPEIVVCHTNFLHIDDCGRVTGRVSRNHCSSPSASNRFATMASARDFCEETYGVIRSDIFARTHLQQDYTGSDRTLMSEIALYGPYYNIDEYLFKKRLHRANQYLDWRTRMAWFGDDFVGRIVLPWWVQFADYLRVIRRVPMVSAERGRCYLFMFTWAARNSRHLLKDLLVAGVTVLRSRERRLKRFAETRNWA